MVMWSALDTVKNKTSACALLAGNTTHFSTYTCTFRSVMSAEGEVGKRKEEMATPAATAKAADVKKPKTFCRRTSEECILSRRAERLRVRNGLPGLAELEREDTYRG